LHKSNHNQSGAKITRYLADDSATAALGASLARALVPGLVIYLCGNLGAGKTALARAVLRGLGYEGKVKSPTFTLVELYAISRLTIYHFDLYRFGDPREWVEAGFRDYFGPDTVCLVEWPEKAEGVLPPADLRITLQIQDSGRSAEIEAGTEAGNQCLTRLEDTG
jgi:tRNA threonylcarbamoyladenosine biosynthesis protein TsaE